MDEPFKKSDEPTGQMPPGKQRPIQQPHKDAPGAAVNPTDNTAEVNIENYLKNPSPEARGDETEPGP